jgi:hypothetical protein
VYKVKITTDLRKYTALARGTKAWKTIFKRRTAVERVNAYLKQFFQLNNVRYRAGKRAKVHFDLVTLVYNASRLAADCIRKMLEIQQKQVASSLVFSPARDSLVFSFRSWVAHGKQNEKTPPQIDPIIAYNRLIDFLDKLPRIDKMDY